MRLAGILLHITSLPSPFGVGDLGPAAYEFVDFLEASGQKLWQILPLNPTCMEFGNSPYFSISLFAGNPLLISPELLCKEGLLSDKDIQKVKFQSDRVDYERASRIKMELLEKAFSNFGEMPEYLSFEEENGYWLEDYCRFKVLRDRFKKPWREWESESVKELELQIKKEKFFQFLFFKQWKTLKAYANSKGIRVMGDLPIYPAFDSSDVWSHRDLFKLDENNMPYVVAGVPPDYFSPTGQLWGNPVYNWDRLKETGFSWWIERIRHNLKLFDLLRLDHFRGFVAYYEVPASEKTAIVGRWVKAPAEEFFAKLKREFPDFPFVAEDLGLITPDVERIRDSFGFPGMKVLAFAFEEDNHPFMPHNHQKNSFVYTGTHDNAPIRSWFLEELSSASKERLLRYLGRAVDEEQVSDALVRLAYMSVAKACVIPMQDILNLGKEARMNTPGKKEGNWEWKLKRIPDEKVAQRLRELCTTYGR
ncbi:MAG: 4-alpha-glucanotransferase [Hydrogenobacter thermophilus]|uniref:4-alpha-glucanotransferase n=1 Tax=Hydrogenobacter thermophilus TaxID=940 RepID=UPI001C78B594|nr:4-alpha-glucanotransferase [Hydrogenobacter thermophilus]QWK19668.1 MAG: 4-alpha-glucanotransferase [Hydrogenobacter thermophilus]